MADSDSGRGGPFQYVLELLQEAWRTLREDQLTDSLLARLAAALRNGLVLYLLALLFFSVALIASRLVIMELYQYQRDLEQELNETFKGRHEAVQGDKHFGVLAALLRRVNNPELENSRRCPPDREGCRRIHAFLRTFHLLSKEALKKEPSASSLELVTATSELPAQPPSLDPEAQQALMEVGEELRRLLPANMLPEDLWEWRDQAAANLQAYWKHNESLPLRTCEFGRPSGSQEESSHDGDFGPRICEQEDWNSPRTRLFLSSLENLQGEPLSKGVGKRLQVKKRVQRAYWLSRLMDDALVPLVPENCTVGDTEEYSFIQAYFISPDNLMRLWQCTPGGKVSPDRFARTRQWSFASYFQGLLLQREPRAYDTATYFDFGGFGLIRTRCERVMQTDSEDKDSEVLLGVICADYKVPQTDLERSMVGSRLLKVEHVDMMPGEDGGITAGSVHTWLLGADGKPSPRQEDDEARRRALAQALKQRLDKEAARAGQQTDRLLRALGQQVSRLELPDGSTTFLVPLGLDAHQRLNGLLITPGVQPPRIGGPALLALGCLAASVLLVVLGQTRARREGEAETVTDLLKNLEVGVLIVNEDEQVEAANDMAEDILGVLLPKIGRLRVDRGMRPQQGRLGEDGVQQNFLDLIEPYIVRVNEQGRPRSYSERYEEVIPRQRGDNDSSTYYVRLRMGLNAGRWIRVSASPITLPQGLWRRRRQATLPRTFGIVTLVRQDGKTHEELKKALEKKAGRR